MKIQEQLFALQDKEYREFQSKLVPGIDRETIIGIRIPAVRKLAKSYAKEQESREFLQCLPHTYYDENILHALLVSDINDYQECVEAVDRFLPFVDNWAVCDIFSPRVFKKNREDLIGRIRKWSVSREPYTCRFGMKMLMTHFLEGDFREEYLDMVSALRSDEYYVNMMTAWYFATALAKQYEAALPYIEGRKLDVWTHNKAIQKARESRRVSREHKEYLGTLKIK